MNVTESEKVLRRFGVEPVSIATIKETETGRGVWQVTATTGARYVLKRVRLVERAALVAAVGQYLLPTGLPLVASLPGVNGEPYVMEDGLPHLLFPWVEGSRPDYNQPGLVERLADLLGQFHERSQGYVATGGPCEWQADWEPAYTLWIKRLKRMSWQALCSGDAFSRTFYPHLPWLYARAKWALDRLPGAGLPQVLAAFRCNPLLAHGDYSRDNVLLGPDGGLTIIDLDQTAVQLPVWDLSRLVTWINHDLQRWDAASLHRVLQAYEQVRPLSQMEKDLLLVDQVFPHQALAIARAYYTDAGSPTLGEELERCVETDRAKLADLGLGPAP